MTKSVAGNAYGSAAKIGLAAVILIGVFVFLFFLSMKTTKEADMVITRETFEIKAMYGSTFKFSDVTSIELKDNMPAVGKKVDGSGLGESKKGYFEVDGMGKCLLFIHADKGPFLYINVSNTHIIMNYKDGIKTKQVYQDLIANWNK